MYFTQQKRESLEGHFIALATKQAPRRRSAPKVQSRDRENQIELPQDPLKIERVVHLLTQITYI
jgi:hypothetical protein